MPNLTLNDYQDKAMSTCMPESDNLFYMLANLVGEVGEFASKAGKHMRKASCISLQCSATRKAKFCIHRCGIFLMKNDTLCSQKLVTYFGRLRGLQR